MIIMFIFFFNIDSHILIFFNNFISAAIRDL
jgi:hypothetical protein